jgi:hypothetical protein
MDRGGRRPRHLALINPNDTVTQYYHSLLVIFYQRVMGGDASIFERHADYALVVRTFHRKLKETVRVDLLNDLKAALKKVFFFSFFF